MTSSRWRPAAIGTLAVGLAMAAMPAATGLPVQDVREGTDVSCFAETEGSYVELFAFFTASGELTESFGAVYTEATQVWAYEGDGAMAGDAFSLALSFVTDAGTPAGTLTVEGEVAPLGDPMIIDDRYRDGNAWTSVEGTVQELLVSGGVTDATGDLAALAGTDLTCSGADVDLTFRGSEPATRIFRGTGASAFCQIGADGFLAIDVFDEQTYATLALGIDFDEETADLIAQGVLDRSGDTFSGLLDVLVPESDPVQVVEVDLTVGSVVDSGRFRFKTPQGAFMQRYETRLLSGTAVLPDGSVVAVEDCELQEYRFLDRFSSRAGQKPGGKVPANDLPSAATEIGSGATVTTSTRGAAEAPEAACLTEEGLELPLGRTVWYRFTGTGDDVTLSTVGSDFDTVIGVYEADLDPVACVDDTAETGLQAAVTVPTTAGTTYLVQVGGFFGDWGKLVVSRS